MAHFVRLQWLISVACSKIIELRERAVVFTAKESNICSGHEIYHIGRIGFGPIGYLAAVVCQSRGRKAIKVTVNSFNQA